MQVVVTAAGRGKRFSEKGYLEPKAAVMVAGRPAITFLIDSFAKDWSLIFVLGEHDRSSNLEKIIKTYRPDSRIIYTTYSERGTIDTVLRAIPFLNPNEGVLISYCDLAVCWNPEEFSKKVQDADMAVVNYQGFHPTYLGPNSYCHVRVDSETRQVIELQEKKLFTDQIETEITSAGIYYFKNKDLLEKALAAQQLQGLSYGKEFYISLAIQGLLNQKQNYRVADFRVEHVFQFGTPDDVERCNDWYEKFNSNEFLPDISPVEKNYWSRIFKTFRLI